VPVDDPLRPPAMGSRDTPSASSSSVSVGLRSRPASRPPYRPLLPFPPPHDSACIESHRPPHWERSLHQEDPHRGSFSIAGLWLSGAPRASPRAAALSHRRRSLPRSPRASVPDSPHVSHLSADPLTTQLTRPIVSASCRKDYPLATPAESADLPHRYPGGRAVSW
jgi:hypothetical protein